MPKLIYSSAVTPALTEGEYQMSELTACDYSESFAGDVAAYILQNVDLDDLGLILCEDDNRGDIRQNYGPYSPKNICVLRRAADNAPVSVYFAAEA